MFRLGDLVSLVTFDKDHGKVGRITDYYKGDNLAEILFSVGGGRRMVSILNIIPANDVNGSEFANEVDVLESGGRPWAIREAQLQLVKLLALYREHESERDWGNQEMWIDQFVDDSVGYFTQELVEEVNSVSRVL